MTSKKPCIEKIKENALLIGTFAGIIIGVLSGLALKSIGVSNDVLTLINYPGELFMRALQLFILPAVVLSLISGAASLNIKENGKIAIKTFAYFTTTSFFNAMVGIALVILISPGSMVTRQDLVLNSTNRGSPRSIQDLSTQPGLLDNMLDLGRNFVPDNIIAAAFQSSKTLYEVKESPDGVVDISKRLITVPGVNFVGLVTLGLVLGSVLSTIGEEAKILVDVIKAAELLIWKSMNIVVWTAPIGMAFIICGKIAEVSDLGETMTLLGWLILTVAIGVAVDQFIIMQLIYFLVLRKNPFKFYMNVFPAVVMAFITRSSAVTLPVTLRCLDEKAKCDPRISHFVVPLGITINRNGTAMYIAVASVFLSQWGGVELSLSDYVSICFTATAMSIAASGPSGSLFVLQTLGVPASEIALLFAIDWFLDRLRTMNNVLGDAYSVAIVEHFSKNSDAELDEIEQKH